MSFPHEDSEFEALLRIVAGERGVAEALVEKDYWVTHTLWALSESTLDVGFKGGTSLSKGFGLITRFSEDLDLKMDRDKLVAISSRFAKAKEAPSFVRHSEDAARIILAARAGQLPPLDQGLKELARDMLAAGDIRAVPVANDPAFVLPAGARRAEVEQAYEAIAPMFWGERVSLDDALAAIRGWTSHELA